MKNSDDDAREYYLSEKAGSDIMTRAKNFARDRGEAFVVFVGSLAVPSTAVRAFREKDDAIEFARDERSFHSGFRNAPKISIKRIKV